jgi:pyruvate,water dikinase
LSAPQILWLGSPGSTERSIVGSKSAHLSALAAIERVPPGFAVTAEAFRGLRAGQSLPQTLREQISSAYRQLANLGDMPTPEVAVRSSAIDEDSAGASFAGQHQTSLNITGEDAVIAAVEESWESAWTEQALGYRKRNGLGSASISFSVLVQQLVRADVSAVLFSANPLNGDADETVITATWGLGESLVGGTATPDTWIVERGSGALLEMSIGSKQRMTVPHGEGVREVDVPRALRHLPTLSSRQVGELVSLGASLESRMGWPVDVELAYRDGVLYLLQCRPITTLEVAARAA